VIVGGVLGAVAALATWLGTRSGHDPAFAELVRRASDRYVATSITAWEFARGKLRGDPLYRTVITSGILPSGGLLVDVGCGQGLMLALLAEAAVEWRQRTWPSELPRPPLFDRLSGIELRPHVAALARRALGGDAEIVEADARTRPLERCGAVLLFDVLHLMPKDDQDRLMQSVFAALDPGGVILVREADASAGWRFQAVRFGNGLKALVFGRWRQSFHFRTATEWRTCFQDAGFRVEARDTSGDTPFGNVLFVLSRRSASA
jgi:SAM-dependent methyltransferase